MTAEFSASELSDKDIMARTEVETQAASGRMRFSITLPSGRKVESDWFQESSKTRWLLKWCGAVNNEIRADAEEELARQKKLARERKPQKPLHGVPTAEPGFPTLPPLGATDGGTFSTTAGPQLTADPLAFLNQAVDAAEKAAMVWRSEAERVNKELERAEANLKKWKAAHAAMNRAEPLYSTEPHHGPGFGGG